MNKVKMERLCRTCMNESYSFSPIYEEPSFGDFVLYEVLKDVCQLDVTLGDDLPTFVCKDCSIRLYEFQQFKIRSHEVECSFKRLKESIVETDFDVPFEASSSGNLWNLNEISENNICIKEEESFSENDFPSEGSVPPFEMEERHTEEEVLNTVTFNDICIKEEELEISGNEFLMEDDMLQVKLEERYTEEARMNRVSNFPVHFAESGDPFQSKGVVKIQEENGIQVNVLGVEEVNNRFCKENMVFSKEKNDVNDIARVGARNAVTVFIGGGVPNNPVLNYNNAQEVSRDRIEGTMCKIADCNDLKSGGRKFRNTDVGDIEQGLVSASGNVHCVDGEGSLIGEGSNFDDGKRNENDYGRNNGGNCRLLKCHDCGDEFANKMDLLNHTTTHYGEIDNGCRLEDSVTVTREGEEGERVDRKRSYDCDSCNKRFCLKGDLRMHKRIHTGKTRLKCKWCKKDFISRSALKQHEFVHTGEKPFKCRFCGKGFTQNGTLKTHLRVHTGEKPHKCRFCPKDFTQRSHRRRHEMVHRGEEPFRCKYCDKRFTQGNAMKIHERVHTGEKPFKCELCSKEFNNRSNLKKHERVHSGERPFKCSMCNKGFYCSSNLREHEKVHTGEKPYKCKFCDKMFAQCGSMKIHERVHTGERPFRCKMCDKRFYCSSNLKDHERVHSGEKPFTCDLCNKNFRQAESLKKHKRRLHLGETKP